MSNQPAVAEVDPWLDQDFAPLASGRDPEPLIDAVTGIANEPPPVQGRDERGAEFEQPAVEPVVEPAPEPEGPEVMELKDGSTVTIEQTKRGLKATLEPATGAKAEVFYGKDRDDLMRNVLVGKVNATKQIHELSQRAKQAPVAGPPEPAPRPGVTKNELTADQKFEIKTALDSGDVAKAMDLTFKYQYGRGMEDVILGADSGRVAKGELDVEGVCNAFIRNNPDYYADPQNQNFFAILAWLANHIQGCPAFAADGSNADQITNLLAEGGFWTVPNLQRAYNDLLNTGRIVSEAPVEEELPAEEDEPEEVVAPAPRRVPHPQAQPAPQSERIVRTVRRPRAGLGIRPTAASGGRPPDTDATKAPSAEELDNLSDAEFERLYSDTLRQARQSARR